MKKQLLNLTMLLLVCLLGGGKALGAVTTYDFKSFVAGGAPNLILTESSVTQSGTNAKTVYIVGKQTNNNKDVLDLSRIALCSQYNTANQMRWMWRSSANAYQTGLAGNWYVKGATVTSYNISVLSLNKGDKITITYAIQPGKSAKPHVCSSNILSSDGTTDKALAAEAEIASGTKYTVMADGNLDMYFTNNNMAIQSISIESDKIDESIDAPVISVVGADNGNRIVSIKTNDTNAGNATTTYYTTDGTTPSTSSKVYNGNITLTEQDATNGVVTVKALTVKTDDNTVKSEVTSLEISGIGTVIELNKPVISIAFKQVGNNYVPVYSFTSDQSSLIGSPTVKYTYNINNTAAEGVNYEAAETGILTVKATADGYTSSETSVEILNTLYNQSYFYDFTKFTEHSDATVGSQQMFNGVGCQAYSIEINEPNMTIEGLSQLWAITAGKTLGFYARTGKASITYNGEFPNGSMIYAEGNNNATTYSTNKVEYAQYGFVKNITVYVPVQSLPLSTEYTLSTYAPATDVDLTNEAGVEFYAAKVNGTSVALKKVEGKVKAGTGLLVKNTKSVESVTLACATDGAEVADNDLKGATKDMTAAELVADNAYILVSDTQFQKVGNSTTGSLTKGKAYLSVNNASAARLLTIGNPTGINGVTEKADAQGADVIYNVQGMRVEKAAANGLYIINGKKYIKK